jgi:hypothetical protein
MDKSLSVWVVQGTSESSDHYLEVFTKKPTYKELSRLAHWWDGDEDKQGSGFDGSYVYLDVKRHDVNRRDVMSVLRG